MSDYNLYYQNNPHENALMTIAEQEAELEEAVLNALDELKASDFIDFGLEYDLDAFNAVIKGIAIAYYNKDEKQLLTYARSAGQMMMSSIEDYVENKI